MARGKKGSGGKAGANGASRKAEATKSDRRKNSGISKTAARAYAGEYNRLLDEKATANGEFMIDIKNLLEKAGNETGIPRKVMRIALQEQRRERDRIAAEKEMEPVERDHLKSLRDALGSFVNTPLGQSAASREDAGEPVSADDGDF